MSHTGSRPGAFDHLEIERILPHRYPFQLVDRVLELEDGRRILALKNASLGDFFFRGHFPGVPVMPGVLICEALAQAGAFLVFRSTDGVEPGRHIALTGLDKVKFRRPVVPGDQLLLEVTLHRKRRPLWRMHGVARVDDAVAAEAEISAMEVQSGGPA